MLLGLRASRRHFEKRRDLAWPLAFKAICNRTLGLDEGDYGTLGLTCQVELVLESRTASNVTQVTFECNPMSHFNLVEVLLNETSLSDPVAPLTWIIEGSAHVATGSHPKFVLALR
jgi:hypothetical protein